MTSRRHPEGVVSGGAAGQGAASGKATLSAAKAFAAKVYESVLGQPIPQKRAKVLRELLEKSDKGTYAHAEVRVLVYETIKSQNWLGKEPLDKRLRLW